MVEQRIIRKRTNYVLFAHIQLEELQTLDFFIEYPVDKVRYELGKFDLTALEAGLYDGVQPGGALHLVSHEESETHIVSAGVVRDLIAWGRLVIKLNQQLIIGPIGSRSRLSPLACHVS